MEHKAHTSQSYSTSDSLSRIAKDLLDWFQGRKDPIDGSVPSAMHRVLARRRTAKPPHIGIIGAGFAGLRCAEKLLEKGFKVTILEGRDRIGGRVHQMNNLGHPVDMGPNWIHGTDHNPILDLAKETNTDACKVGEATAVFDEEGRTLDAEKSNSLFERVWGIIADAFKYSNEAKDIPSTMSLKNFFVQQLKDKDVPESESKLVMQMAEMWGAFVGSPWERQSLKFFWLEECIDGENLFVASTYKAILDRVAKAALGKADIHLSAKVISIETITTSEGSTSVTVNTSTSPFTFDEVVVTIPLGCLKRNTIAFHPPLPPRALRAISNLNYGCLEKVYVIFPFAFWDSPSESNSNPSEDPSKSEVATAPYAYFSHFLHPTYSHLNPSSWNIELVSLSAFPSIHSHPTLLFYIYGPCAQHLTSLLKHFSPSSPKYRSTINTFFEPYYSLLPNYSASDPTCTPSGVLASGWLNDEFAGHGSYTNFQTREEDEEGREEVRYDEDVEVLREGVPERRIWLAGEHTSPFVALGTVTGAWWSGEKVGERIVAAYEGDNEGEVKGAKAGDAVEDGEEMSTKVNGGGREM